MSYVSKEIAGLKIDEGAAFFVKESARSEEAAASISNAQLQTSKFMGKDARREYLLVQSTALTYGMQASANHLPDIKLAYEQFRTSYKPSEALPYLDQVLEFFGGTVSAPAMRVVPVRTLSQSAYKSSEGMTGAMNGVWKYDGYLHVPDHSKLVCPRPLAEVTDGITALDAAAMKYLTPEDRVVVNELHDVYQVWKMTRVVAADGKTPTVGNLTEDAVKRILSSLQVMRTRDASESYTIAIDDRGLPYAVDPSGKRLSDEDLVSLAVPKGTVTISGKSADLKEQFAGHLAGWKNKAPKVENLTPVDKADVIIETQTNARKLADKLALSEVTHMRRRTGRDTYNVLNESSLMDTMDTATVQNHLRLGDIAYFTFKLSDGAPEIVQVGLLAGERPTDVAVMERALTAARRTFAYRRLAESFRSFTETLIKERNAVYARESVMPGFALVMYDLIGQAMANPTPRRVYDYFERAKFDYTALKCDPKNKAAVTKRDQALSEAMQITERLLKDYGAIYMTLATKDQPKGNAASELAECGYTVIASGRWEPTATDCVVMMPILGMGVAPVYCQYDSKTNTYVTAKKQLNMAVVLEEPPVTVCSPVRTMIMTAALKQLLDYMDGKKSPPGHTFEVFDPNSVSMYQSTTKFNGSPSPRALLYRQLQQYTVGLAHEIEGATIDTIAPLLEKASVLVDAKLALEHMDDVMDAIIDRDDWSFMLQSLIVGACMSHGAKVKDSANRLVKGIHAGVAPWDVVRYIFSDVLADVKDTKGYAAAVDAAVSSRTLAPNEIVAEAAIQRLVKGEVLLARVRRGWKLLVSLLDGSEPLAPTVRSSKLRNLIDADISLDITRAIGTLLERDYLGILDHAQFEAPWTTADWATQFANFSVSVLRSPIGYRAYDLGAEVAQDSGLTSLAAALANTGFRWTEIAPMMARVTGSHETSQPLEGGPWYFAGAGVGPGDDELYNDAPVSHQTMRLTTMIPMYDVEGYNMLKAYLTSCTSRTYFAQPVGRDVSDSLLMKFDDMSKDDIAALGEMLNYNKARLAAFLNDGWTFEKCPALADSAIIVPYIASFLTKTALSRDEFVPQCIDIDTASSIATTSGVTIVPGNPSTELISYGNGLAITMRERTSVSTALDWVGS